MAACWGFVYLFMSACSRGLNRSLCLIAGLTLASTAAEQRHPQPKGRRYRHAGNGDSDLLARFSAQFADPWSFFSHSVDNEVRATLLRLPLRVPAASSPSGAGAGTASTGRAGPSSAAASKLEGLFVSEADARHALAAFASMAGRGLLFSRCERRVSVVVWERRASTALKVFGCKAKLVQPSGGVAVLPGGWLMVVVSSFWDKRMTSRVGGRFSALAS